MTSATINRPAVRRPGPGSRWWFAIAAVGGLLSLGLPWSRSYSQGVGGFTYGYWSPGLCYNSYDSEGWATTYCDPWYMPPMYQPGGGFSYQTTGAEHPARVLLVLTVVALVVGYRRNSRAVLLAAPLLAALGLFGFGITGLAGQVAYAVGLAALLMALHRDGLIGRGRPAHTDG